MNDLVIQTHDFDEAKNQLKEFSEKIPSSIDLETVAANGGLFGWFDHNVTGDELNRLTTQIQSHLININNLNLETIKEFGQVYNALELLDKDYIQAIILSIKAAEKASEQAKRSASEAQKNTIDISKSIEVQKKTISALNSFKMQIDKYEHLKDIDEIWSDCQTFKKDMSLISSRIKSKKEELDSDADAQISILRDTIHENRVHYEEKSKLLIKKLQIAYILAGGSVGVALLSFILHVLGIA